MKSTELTNFINYTNIDYDIFLKGRSANSKLRHTEPLQRRICRDGASKRLEEETHRTLKARLRNPAQHILGHLAHQTSHEQLQNGIKMKGERNKKESKEENVQSIISYILISKNKSL